MFYLIIYNSYAVDIKCNCDRTITIGYMITSLCSPYFHVVKYLVSQGTVGTVTAYPHLSAFVVEKIYCSRCILLFCPKDRFLTGEYIQLLK